MKRLLVFLLLFPVLGAVAFYAITYALTGAALDSGTGPVFMFLVLITPGLFFGLLDWLVAKTSLPIVAATTLLVYGLTVAALAWALGPSMAVLALGLIGAVPAGVCSWMSNGEIAETA